ncbi:MAG: ABC transporter ATP-binding protein [Lachnospiraceae bacterium]|nr:ABC transporter ATP-binding protein [Lachnospiraceae bacterium]
MNELLKVEELVKDGILSGISFTVAAGEMIAVMGPSGSGKSTLLYNVSGMDRADGGKVRLKDTEISALSEEEKAHVRLMRMGFVFQQMNVLSNLNVIDNICFPAVYAKGKKQEKQIREKALKLMEEFDIADLAEHMTNEVSGGQLQRACILRSMMMDPEILFADEPTGALNQKAAGTVIDAFLRLNKDGATILMVTHDSKVAQKCDRVLYILDGALKGELKLGKYDPAAEEERQKKINAWLASFGW